MTAAANLPAGIPSRHSPEGDRAEVVGSAFARVETIVRALRQTGELARARRLCGGILRALGDVPELPFSPALIVQEASACGDLEAARAAFQANPCGATCRQLLHVIEAHERSECEVCAALAGAYRQ